jgi:hypothetical protein
VGRDFETGGTMLDTSKLVVGQEVYMESGVYCSRGTVVEVTPKGVVVRDWTWFADGTYRKDIGTLLKFDINGKGCDPGTFECGPWELLEPPSYLLGLAERTAKLL